MIFACAGFLSLASCVAAASVINSKGHNYTSVPLDEEEIYLFRKVYGKLDTFLERNLEGGQRNLEKVLSAFGVYKEVPLKIDPQAPLENTILQYQIAMHQDMKNMFRELKALLNIRSNSDLREQNEIVVNGYKTSDNKKDLTSLKGKGEFKNASLKPFDERVSTLQDYERYTPTDSAFRPADCSEILVAGLKESGVYEIYPFRCQCTEPVEAYCDMDTDGGGWTVFLSRKNDSKPINFTRNWQDYKTGFGTPGKEHWLGNEHLHTLTYNRNYILRLEAKDGEGRDIWGEWNTFKVESEDLKYKLSSTTFNSKSTAYDRFAYVNGNYFSTFDRDSDKNSKTNCASTYKGGWWYNSCHNNNPTGEHEKKDGTGIRISPWSRVDKTVRYATWLQLKIRPKICSTTISVANVNTHNCAFN